MLAYIHVDGCFIQKFPYISYVNIYIKALSAQL
jgi:hypothetical protein